MKLTTLFSSGALLSTAAAHGGELSYNFAGKWYNGFVPYNSPSNQPATIQREWDTYNPILDVTTNDLRCNTNGAASQMSATVAAGSKVTAYWNQWPHTIGPLVVWMANCGGSCTTFDGSGAKWFKIDQSGLISGTLTGGLWGQGQMVNQNSTWTSTIPAFLKPGNYLIRHELIAIHTSNAPQFYPECAQLTITGSGTAVPGASSMASIPGVYSMSDPEININIYSNENQGVTTYNIPGPAVWKG